MHDIHAVYLKWVKNTHKNAKQLFDFSKGTLAKREPCFRLLILKPVEFEKLAKYYATKKHGWLSEPMLNDIRYKLAKIQDDLKQKSKSAAEIAELKNAYNWFVKPRDGAFWPVNASWRKNVSHYDLDREWTAGHPDHPEHEDDHSDA